jgi:hypothetical protein
MLSHRYSSAPWAFQTAHLARQEAHAGRRAVAEGAALARPRRWCRPAASSDVVRARARHHIARARVRGLLAELRTLRKVLSNRAHWRRRRAAAPALGPRAAAAAAATAPIARAPAAAGATTLSRHGPRAAGGCRRARLRRRRAGERAVATCLCAGRRRCGGRRCGIGRRRDDGVGCWWRRARAGSWWRCGGGGGRGVLLQHRGHRGGGDLGTVEGWGPGYGVAVVG